ncbi:hypothetical protein O181_095554 [Austropuccinia psidii MF-1]|uniref:HAT C-terminal dimerisation domain-containing protein n=1 Tax=Austropuccinia psidii MF-1 TaxID=1389203 RepID=A0A9Q3J5C9_9BASI|nr:hypothetical protein [Austropuccinia psidii MF-1]
MANGLNQRGTFDSPTNVAIAVAKDFLLYMGQLTNEDYDFFDDYLAITNNSIEDSNNNDQESIKAVINILECKCSTLAQNKQSGGVTGYRKSSSDNLREPETFDLLKHLKQPLIEAMYDVLHSHNDEVTSYLQNTHPMTKGEHILDYWKCQIISQNFPNLGKVVLRYLSIPASSASVERVFSHSGRLKCSTRASLGSRTIAHLTFLKEWLNNEYPPV